MTGRAVLNTGHRSILALTVVVLGIATLGGCARPVSSDWAQTMPAIDPVPTDTSGVMLGVRTGSTTQIAADLVDDAEQLAN